MNKKLYILLTITLILLIMSTISIREKYEDILKIKVYCINRASRPDRLTAFWEYIKKSIFYNYLDIEIVPAVDKDNLMLNKLKIDYRPGEVGCYYSHIKCFLNLLSTDKSIEYCLIFEDDAICNDHLKDIIEKFMKQNDNYDLLILGDNYRQGEIECIEDENLKINICKGFNMIFGAHAYIINKKAVNVLLANAFPMKNPFDLFYSDPAVYKDLKVGLTNTAICNPKNLNDSNTN